MRAIALKWTPGTMGLVLSETGDGFEYMYDTEAEKQTIYLAIRFSETTQRLVNCHPDKIANVLNELTEEMEDNEWSLVLGSIELDYEFTTGTLYFKAISDTPERKPIELALELTRFETNENKI